jgi:hypothetical protein
VTADGIPPPQAPSPAPGPRPAAVTTLATLGVIFGTFGLLCKPSLLAITLFLKLPQPDPTLSAVQDNPILRAFATIDGLTGTLVSLLLLISSIGCLSLKPWARLGMLCYAVLALLLTMVVQGVGYFVLGPELEQALRNAGAPAQKPWTQSVWVLAVGVALRLWYPILILAYFNRRDVKQAFEQGLVRKDI